MDVVGISVKGPFVLIKDNFTCVYRTVHVDHIELYHIVLCVCRETIGPLLCSVRSCLKICLIQFGRYNNYALWMVNCTIE